ncbi:MAG: hypothetical protein ACREVK_01050 [Gammaproteobacteria bacterium]
MVKGPEKKPSVARTGSGGDTPKARSEAGATADNGEAGEGHPTDFPVIAIGASAVGLEALKKFFSAMPPQAVLASW